MPLYQQLAADFAAMLADANGPARRANVGGQDFPVIIDQPDMIGQQPDGYMREMMDIYILAEHLGYKPHAGQQITLDGVQWTIDQPHHLGTVYRLQCSRYLS